LDRVVLQQVGQVVGGDDVAHGHDVEFLGEKALFVKGPEDQAADAAESIDRDLDCHVVPPIRVEGKEVLGS
jgi:hypothetical protein